MSVCMLSHFSRVWLFATPWTVAHQAPLSVGFSRLEYWSGLPCPPLGDLPDPGIELASLVSLHWKRILYPLSHLGSHFTPTEHLISLSPQFRSQELLWPSAVLLIMLPRSNAWHIIGTQLLTFEWSDGHRPNGCESSFRRKMLGCPFCNSSTKQWESPRETPTLEERHSPFLRGS